MQIAALLKLTMGEANYFFGSGLLHFSQVFLFLVASTQHLCVHSFPAFFASVQQLALTVTVFANRPRTAIRDNNLMLFITSFLGDFRTLR
jgi:hypothetical protein